MTKMTTYLIIMSGLLLLFYFFGLLPSTTISGGLLDVLLNPSQAETSTLWLKIIGAIGIAATVSILAALFAGKFQGWEWVQFAPVGLALAGFGFDFIQVISALADANTTLAVLLFSPAFIVYLLTVVEWVRGITT